MPNRRLLLRSVGTGAAAALGLLGLAGATRQSRWARSDLLSEAVVFDGTSRRLLRRTEMDDLIPSTRVMRTAERADDLVTATEGFLAQAQLPVLRTPSALPRDLDTQALLDIHSLTWELPSPVAAWTPAWRYTWPRDTAHVIAALTGRGQWPWALALLETLATQQRPDGRFEARYIPGTNRTPDARPLQLDGCGWFLWAAADLLADEPALAGPAAEKPRGRVDAPRELRAALARSAAALMRATGRRSLLPPPSPDYWEVSERRLTLATGAMTAAGLHAASRLVSAGVLTADDLAGAGTVPVLTRGSVTSSAPLTADMLAQRRDGTTATLLARFRRRGYQRYALGGGVDAGVLMLLPPYLPRDVADSNPQVIDAALAAYEKMRRPAGGVAPGAGWKKDGISWTPQTAMFAQAYAHLGMEKESRAVLRWLAEHRTAAGAIPEKVLSDGTPAAVAPLAWSASLIVATLTQLDAARRSEPARAADA
ncbi:hypothetical protein M3A96_10330 [Helcobacillus massiliensis]|uniref:hypothetical protein n=1 Tax=Helcobacillus massiliensis TaxID=521392 RepID=UPI0021A6F17F|nr:hypothetical protein [Helcobacillus massiliensis]MCT1558507.1 hypothetical protein [Helcobacillus massiliensis]MCT2036046.1 hypothetical protein [Helcobacillus massiliensis]MCT2332746.1 hypothetical protein [Helcobacillus massiliensis]